MSLYLTLDNNSQFRLQEISTLRSKLETEAQERKQLCKKYKRAENILDGIDIGANSIALSLSVTSGVLASTGILLPVGNSIGCSCWNTWRSRYHMQGYQ